MCYIVGEHVRKPRQFAPSLDELLRGMSHDKDGNYAERTLKAGRARGKKETKREERKKNLMRLSRLQSLDLQLLVVDGSQRGAGRKRLTSQGP